MTKSRGINKPKFAWGPVELELLVGNYADSRSDDLAKVIGCTLTSLYQKARKLGLAKSEAYLAGPDACRLRKGDGVGSAYRFKPGQVPANKGLRRPGWASGNMASTQFKKGQPPLNEMPVGSYRVNTDGFLEFKFNDEPGPYTKRWIPVHRKIWIEANGPIPKGHVIAFRPGRRSVVLEQVTLDALECITLADNMRRNSVHTVYPPELVHATQLRAAITRQINKRSKEQA